MDESVHLQATLYAEQFKRNGRVEVHFLFFFFFCVCVFKSLFGCAFATVQYNQLTCVSMHCFGAVQYV